MSCDFKKLQMENTFVFLFYLDKFRKTQRLRVDIFLQNIPALCRKLCRGKEKVKSKNISVFLQGSPFRKTRSELPMSLPKYEG